MTDNNNVWPDPARPGVPLNPEWDGAHHWLSYEGEEPGLYEWDGKYWKMGGGHAPMDYVVDHFTYIAPALTPAEVDARVKQARREALEEAARVAEGKVYKERYRTWPWWLNRDGSEGNRSNDSDIVEHADKIAAAIRALKGEGHD
jgi:hypothetical protein